MVKHTVIPERAVPASASSEPVVLDGEPASDLEQQFVRMLEIRLFEQNLLDMFRSNRLNGTTHTYIGQEAIAVAALQYLRPGDGVFSSHRCHGHFLAAGGDPRSLFLEILGDRRGVCGGVGGSQHLHDGRFYSNGIQGGIAPIATGLALADRIGDTGNIMVCFLGDGTLGEGVLYESLNLASLWQAPILFVLENNRYAQTTSVEDNLAGSMAERFRAFGIEAAEIESNDIVDLNGVFAHAFERVRSTCAPYCQIVHTYRLEAHSKGDDFRDPAEIAAWWKHDPIVLAEKRIGIERAEELKGRVRATLDEACTYPETDEPPVLSDIEPDAMPPDPGDNAPAWRRSQSSETMLGHLQNVLGDIMASRSDVHMIGEDLLDPYGGAFKVTKGLSTQYPDRVWTTPISEAAIVGVANGLALAGLRPVVEIMFGDFVTLAIDQLVNHAGKFARMYGNGTACPIIVRTPMGGRRGYGPTHSQSLEKVLTGIPGLTVTATDPLHDQKHIWARMLNLNGPCVYIENKALYGSMLPVIEEQRYEGFQIQPMGGYFPTSRLSLDENADAVILCYGAMLTAATQAAMQAFVEHERIVDIVVASCLSPVPAAELARGIGDVRNVILVEEGTRRNGVMAEWLAALHDHADMNNRQVRRIAAPDTIIPNDKRLEMQILPTADKILSVLRTVWT